MCIDCTLIWLAEIWRQIPYWPIKLASNQGRCWLAALVEKRWVISSELLHWSLSTREPQFPHVYANTWWEAKKRGWTRRFVLIIQKVIKMLSGEDALFISFSIHLYFLLSIYFFHFLCSLLWGHLNDALSSHTTQFLEQLICSGFCFTSE